MTQREYCEGREHQKKSREEKRKLWDFKRSSSASSSVRCIASSFDRAESTDGSIKWMNRITLIDIRGKCSQKEQMKRASERTKRTGSIKLKSMCCEMSTHYIQLCHLSAFLLSFWMCYVGNASLAPCPKERGPFLCVDRNDKCEEWWHETRKNISKSTGYLLEREMYCIGELWHIFSSNFPLHSSLARLAHEKHNKKKQLEKILNLPQQRLHVKNELSLIVDGFTSLLRRKQQSFLTISICTMECGNNINMESRN